MADPIDHLTFTQTLLAGAAGGGLTIIGQVLVEFLRNRYGRKVQYRGFTRDGIESRIALLHELIGELYQSRAFMHRADAAGKACETYSAEVSRNPGNLDAAAIAQKARTDRREAGENLQDGWLRALVLAEKIERVPAEHPHHETFTVRVNDLYQFLAAGALGKEWPDSPGPSVDLGAKEADAVIALCRESVASLKGDLDSLMMGRKMSGVRE